MSRMRIVLISNQRRSGRTGKSWKTNNWLVICRSSSVHSTCRKLICVWLIDWNCRSQKTRSKRAASQLADGRRNHARNVEYRIANWLSVNLKTKIRTIWYRLATVGLNGGRKIYSLQCWRTHVWSRRRNRAKQSGKEFVGILIFYFDAKILWLIVQKNWFLYTWFKFQKDANCFCGLCEVNNWITALQQRKFQNVRFVEIFDVQSIDLV